MSVDAPAVEIPDHVPPERVYRFDFRNDDALRRDPWAHIASLNDLPDIFFSPDLGGYWVVTRAPLIDEVFSRYDLFTATSTAIPKMDNALTLIPNHFDPPAHSVYRKFMANGMFSPRALADLVPDTRRFTISLFDAFPHGHCEFIGEFAYRLPIDIFLSLMGADLAHREECLTFVKGVMRGRTGADVAEAFAMAYDFAARWLDEQLTDPDANSAPMFQAMVNGRLDGRSLTIEEMRSITIMLLMGGLDTITSQMSHIMRFLAENPGHRDYLVANPEAVPIALEEMLRRFGISFIGRAAAADFIWNGVAFKKGDAVCAGTPIAGLDKRAFPEPLAVNFERGGAGRRVKHLAFGSGPHVCIGAYLARTQLSIMLEELLPRMPGLRVTPGAAIENMPGATMMLKALPLEWNA